MRQWIGVAAVLALSGCSAPGSSNQGNEVTGAADTVPDLLNGLSPDDRRAFAGNADGNLNDPVASVQIPVSTIERDHLAGRSCSGGAAACDEDAVFLSKVFEQYPDLKRVRFSPDKIIRDDPDSYSTYRRAFYTGLFLAKQMRLANGQSLFDFLVKCSRTVDPLNSAEDARSAQPGTDWSMQFFPVLRSLSDGSAVELNMLYDRKGAQVTSRSQLFSAHALTNPAFLSEHGVECWKR